MRLPVTAGTSQLPASHSPRLVTMQRVRRLLLAGSVLYVIGWGYRLAWDSAHPVFETNGYGELRVLLPMWAGAATVAIAAGWAVAAKGPGRGGYLGVLGGALANLGAEGWHTWVHYHHEEYGAAHVALSLTAGWGVVAVSLVLILDRGLQSTVGRRSAVNRLVIRLHRAAYRLSRGRVGNGARDGDGILLLTTRGRASGRLRTVPLRYVAAGDAYVVVASNSGGPAPQWYENLRISPEVQMQIGPRRRRGQARVAEGAERESLWSLAIAHSERWAQYQARASRSFPVVVIDPAP
jgi:F420H(2)-dependent quinone reductase